MHRSLVTICGFLGSIVGQIMCGVLVLCKLVKLILMSRCCMSLLPVSNYVRIDSSTSAIIHHTLCVLYLY